jgi:hypothetical protein
VLMHVDLDQRTWTVLEFDQCQSWVLTLQC